MPDNYSREIDFDNDVLLRRLDPDLWDRDVNETFPVAFEDPGKNYRELSFYIERCVAGPADLLRLSAHFPSVMKRCGTEPFPPTVEQMLSAGDGVARVPASVVRELDLRIKPTPIGNEIDEVGQVNVINGKSYGIAWADNATVISGAELRKMANE